MNINLFDFAAFSKTGNGSGLITWIGDVPIRAKSPRGRVVSINSGLLNRNFHFELPLHPKTYASYPVVSSANRSGLFEVVVRLILAVLRSRCAGFACPACLAADTYPPDHF